MSIEALSYALKYAPVTDPQALLVLIAIADNAQEDGRDSWPSQKVMAERARCSTRTVRRRLNELENAGVIVRGDQQKVAHIDHGTRPVVWDIPGVLGEESPLSTPGQADRPPLDKNVNPRTTVADNTSTTNLSESNQGGYLSRADRCKKHQTNEVAPPCAGCADARRTIEHYERLELAERRRREDDVRTKRAYDSARAVQDCDMCDHRGRTPGDKPCPHETSATPEEIAKIRREAGLPE